MNQTRGWVGAAVIAFLLVAFMTDWIAEAAGWLASIPWFVYLVIAGILYCGYKFVTLSREDHKVDQEWIEEEGNVFIRRIEQERERRGQAVGGSSDSGYEATDAKEFVANQNESVYEREGE
ncbi:MAG TPA: sporulation YhaL family protein [Bacillales bacterium]